ncbi:MAG: hypothetical protein DRP87_11105 [Spirochaetes bacterium]|nr:MAG: hypothetical protein DRP87_11105 [Spirochaetota bacterium]
MKQTTQLQKVQENMRPGVISLHGFLGDDTRNLVDILIEDNAEVKKLGVTHRRISDKMRELRENGLSGLGEYINVSPHFEVKVEDARGKLPCPFEHPGLFPKINTTVRNLEKNKEIIYTDLNIHLIEAHGFYEGRGAKYRLEPAELVDILEV